MQLTLNPHPAFQPLSDAAKVVWKLSLATLLVLNLLDACFTLSWVCMGEATEANPAMALCLEQGPAVFMAVKMLIVTAAVWSVRKMAHHALAQAGVATCLVAYLAVMTSHLTFLSQL